MLNIRTAKKWLVNKDCVRLIEWNDQAYSTYIKKFNLVLLKHENRVAYWSNEDCTKELVFLYNNIDCSKKVFIAGY